MTNGNDSIHPLIVNINGNNCMEYQGLTKREFFAIKAMQGLLSGRTKYEDNSNSEWYAEVAIRHADALIEQLKKTSL